MKGDATLQKSFVFSCGEAGIEDSDLLAELQQVLLTKMLHTHGNELLESRRLLGNLYSGVVVDAPLMLRDSLKVMAVNTGKK